MQFVQFKLSVVVKTTGSWNFSRGWTISKHKPHLTFFEIQVHTSILNSVLEWVYARQTEIEELVQQINFDRWTVFYKRKLHFAVLAPNPSEFQDIDHQDCFSNIEYRLDNIELRLAALEQGQVASPTILQQRCNFLNDLFTTFGCGEPEADLSADGLPLWRYKNSDGQMLFSCSLYNRPQVWFPHISIAVKFNRLEERYSTENWTSACANANLGGLFHEIIDKSI